MYRVDKKSFGLAFASTAAATLLAAAVSDSGASPTSADAGCKKGSTSATIGGMRVCLRAGQRCNRKLDRQYHRYRFHCHTGRLTRFKTTAPDSPPPPSLPGQRVDVGGYRLYVECTGNGTPTVVFEAGQGGAGATSPLPGATTARGAVAKDARVCAYDRAGLGASDRRPAGIAPTGDRFADELHALLAGANVSGPYVLVGPSFGGLVAAAFAMRYPGDTAGLVFVDSDEPCAQACTYDLPEPGSFDVGAATFGSRPVVVLVAEFGFGGDGRNLARRSTDSMLVTALGSGHAIIGDNPDLVAEATRLVASSVRNGSSLPPCAKSPLPAARGRCETVG